jgi:hypothetical protein
MQQSEMFGGRRRGEFGLEKGIAIAVGVHAVLFLILSIVIIDKNPFQQIQQPLIVNIQAETETIAAGLPDSMSEKTRTVSPHLADRVTRPAEHKALPDKTLPSTPVHQASTPKEAIRENVRKEAAANTSGELRQEKIVPVTPSEDAVKKLDEYLEQEAKDKKARDEMNQMNNDIDKVLNEDSQGTATRPGNNTVIGKGDPLSDAEWSASPRKTLYFPDIQSKIPADYRKKGLSFSLTARISFDPNGLAIKADIVKSSGDPAIDSVFNEELRKIRIESISGTRVDEITKTFSISLR